jgi:hypothetical protein
MSSFPTTNWPDELRKLKLEYLRRLEAQTAALPLWSPFPGKPQEAAYRHPADVLGYGGAAGGAKTDLLIGLAMTAHRRAIIFRREATTLTAIVDRCREILSIAGRHVKGTEILRLGDGRQIEFGGCKDLGDEQKYRGRPHDFIGIDEADQFLEFQVRFLQGWLRTSVPGQRCRVVLTFNPPATADGRWLLDYFGPWIDKKHPRPAQQGELRWYATLPSGKEVERADGQPFVHAGESIQPKSRTFIQSRVQDNPVLMQTGYISTLQALPEPLRSQVLFGDFSAGLEDDPWQVIPTAWVEAAMARWRPPVDGKCPHGYQVSAVGIDVARGGRAQTVFAPRHLHWFAPLQKHPGRTTPDGPSIIRLLECGIIRQRADVLLNIDVIGVGSSPYDLAIGKGWTAFPVNYAKGASGLTDKAGVLTFLNVRAFGYWSLREMLDPANKLNVELPPDRELLIDLTAPRWQNMAGGVKIESKDDIEERIGRSPDCGDAVVNSIFLPAASSHGAPTVMRA